MTGDRFESGRLSGTQNFQEENESTKNVQTFPTVVFPSYLHKKDFSLDKLKTRFLSSLCERGSWGRERERGDRESLRGERGRGREKEASCSKR
jgi:hypothetical protein